MNHQSNLPMIQSSNSSPVQPSSNIMANANSSRNWAINASSRRGYQGTGSRGMVLCTGSNGSEHQQQRHGSHHRGGRRGRGSPRGRFSGQISHRHNIDQRVAAKSTIDDSHDVLSDERDTSNDLSCPDNLESGRQMQCEITGVVATEPVESSEDAGIATSSNGNHVGDRTINQSVSKNNKSTRVFGGKYKQRREARQLIDGLDGLDMDLFESLAPSNADGSSRSRHSTSTRKINLCHLVNYGYDRKHRAGSSMRPNDSTSRGHNERNIQYHYNNHNFRYHHSNEHKFNKQQFLQANCQFVVLDGYDYTIHKVDPDWPVDWNCIEEVKFRQIGATETNCPICLEPPVAAKITKCGHIYCWACMLRYLSMSDDNKVPCPICFEPIYVNDLRSVVSRSYSNHIVGEEISMKLMFRRKGCVVVDPHSYPTSPNLDYESSAIINLNTQNIEENNPHYSSRANLIIVDPMTVVKHVAQREKDELQFRMELESMEIVTDGTDEPESTGYSGMICFIEQALEKVNKRIDKLVQMSSDESRNIRIRSHKFQEVQTNINSDSTGHSYLFYQSADGQHIYLNPFSTKILCHEYGSLEGCPLEISAEVLQMDWISMNEAWRKRFKYLEHLPLSCEFRLIEIDFEKSNLVSPNTFKIFEEQIRTRAKERTRRLREEAKRDKQIQVEQNRKIYGIQPSLEISLDNPEQFPSVSNERYLGLERSRNQNSDDSPTSSDKETKDAANFDRTHQVTLSFAEIQLQEVAKAEKAARQQKRQKQTNPGQWAGPSNRSSVSTRQSATQSSYAQLLVDAKTSQQKWTKSTGSSSKFVPWGTKSAISQQTSSSSQQRLSTQSTANNQTAHDSDDGVEELRAPPCEFSMSDYLDMNVISGKKRGKKKKS